MSIARYREFPNHLTLAITCDKIVSMVAMPRVTT